MTPLRADQRLTPVSADQRLTPLVQVRDLAKSFDVSARLESNSLIRSRDTAESPAGRRK